MPLDHSTFRFLVDSILAAHDGRCLDEPEERDLVARAFVDVLTEYLRPRTAESEQ